MIRSGVPSICPPARGFWPSLVEGIFNPMSNHIHQNAYVNPWDVSEDKAYMERLTDILQRWFRARNGQKEDIIVEAKFGMDKPTGQTMAVLIKATLRPKPDGLIGIPKNLTRQ